LLEEKFLGVEVNGFIDDFIEVVHILSVEAELLKELTLKFEEFAKAKCAADESADLIFSGKWRFAIDQFIPRKSLNQFFTLLC
jgi:hypothetical protein